MKTIITLKELLDFEFTANEDGEIIALVPLSRLNDIADILTNQKEKIDKAIENLFELKDMIYEPKTREINFDVQRKISETIKILGDKE